MGDLIVWTIGAVFGVALCAASVIAVFGTDRRVRR